MTGDLENVMFKLIFTKPLVWQHEIAVCCNWQKSCIRKWFLAASCVTCTLICGLNLDLCTFTFLVLFNIVWCIVHNCATSTIIKFPICWSLFTLCDLLITCFSNSSTLKEESKVLLSFIRVTFAFSFFHNGRRIIVFVALLHNLTSFVGPVAFILHFESLLYFSHAMEVHHTTLQLLRN